MNSDPWSMVEVVLVLVLVLVCVVYCVVWEDLTVKGRMVDPSGSWWHELKSSSHLGNHLEVVGIDIKQGS